MTEKEPGADHFDAGKPMLDLVPPWALIEVAAVMTYGEGKYVRPDPDGPPNYLVGKGVKPAKLYGSALRHLNAILRGELNDHESGIAHLAHAAANCMMSLEVIRTRRGPDGR
jgi:hypothetical protein